MHPFSDVLGRAAERCGGLSELEKELPKPDTDRQLRQRSDAEYLSLMSLRIFRAGLKHSIVDAKWLAFEEVFSNFDPDRLRMLSDETIESYLKDTRIIRHFAKIKSVRSNAIAIYELNQEFNSMGAYLVDWPQTELVLLWDDLQKRFTQLGGMSAAYFLRMSGKDTFLFTNDVVQALNRWGVLEGEPKSKKTKQIVQAAFNQWQEETERSMCELSKILALSVD